jgi:hypothetical protein
MEWFKLDFDVIKRFSIFKRKQLRDVDIKIGMMLHTKSESSFKKPCTLQIAQTHIDARRPGIAGLVVGQIPYHCGDAWWVKHGNGRIAGYWWDELCK